MSMPRRRRFFKLFVLSGTLLTLCTGRLSAQSPLDRAASTSGSADPKTAIPADLFVDDDNAGAQDGTALRPFRTIQQAIDAGTTDTVVAVAGGTYPQNIRVQDKAVRLHGGYVGGTAADYARGAAGDFSVRDPAAHPSHLKGDGKDSVVTLYEAGSSVVDGFRVTGGGRSATAAPSWVGGGFYIYLGAPTISNNLIENNRTCPPVKQGEEKLGGGIYSTGASIAIVDNVIRNNVSGRGAGVAADGPKIVIRGNIVQSNVGVSDHGGGIYLFSPNAEISYNRIIGNEIGRDFGYGWGGGVTVVNQGGFFKFSHNVFTGNFAPSVGSALFVDEGATAWLDHDLIYANACNPTGNGAVPAVYVDGGDGVGSTLTIDHTTIADHTCSPAVPGNAVNVTGKSKVFIKNSILWNNGGDDIDVDASSKATVTYTLAQEVLKGIGNFSKDPLFADSAHHDYHLRSTAGRWNPTADDKNERWVVDGEHSPAIDAADPASSFALEPVLNGGRANLGFDGNTAHAGKSAP